MRSFIGTCQSLFLLLLIVFGRSSPFKFGTQLARVLKGLTAWTPEDSTALHHPHHHFLGALWVRGGGRKDGNRGRAPRGEPPQRRRSSRHNSSSNNNKSSGKRRKKTKSRRSSSRHTTPTSSSSSRQKSRGPKGRRRKSRSARESPDVSPSSSSKVERKRNFRSNQPPQQDDRVLHNEPAPIGRSKRKHRSKRKGSRKRRRSQKSPIAEAEVSPSPRADADAIQEPEQPTTTPSLKSRRKRKHRSNRTKGVRAERRRKHKRAAEEAAAPAEEAKEDWPLAADSVDDGISEPSAEANAQESTRTRQKRKKRRKRKTPLKGSSSPVRKATQSEDDTATVTPIPEEGDSKERLPLKSSNKKSRKKRKRKKSKTPTPMVVGSTGPIVTKETQPTPTSAEDTDSSVVASDEESSTTKESQVEAGDKSATAEEVEGDLAPETDGQSEEAVEEQAATKQVDSKPDEETPLPMGTGEEESKDAETPEAKVEITSHSEEAKEAEDVIAVDVEEGDAVDAKESQAGNDGRGVEGDDEEDNEDVQEDEGEPTEEEAKASSDEKPEDADNDKDDGEAEEDPIEEKLDENESDEDDDEGEEDDPTEDIAEASAEEQLGDVEDEDNDEDEVAHESEEEQMGDADNENNDEDESEEKEEEDTAETSPKDLEDSDKDSEDEDVPTGDSMQEGVAAEQDSDVTLASVESATKSISPKQGNTVQSDANQGTGFDEPQKKEMTMPGTQEGDESSSDSEIDIPIRVDEVEVTIHVDKEEHVSVRLGDGGGSSNHTKNRADPKEDDVEEESSEDESEEKEDTKDQGERDEEKGAKGETIVLQSNQKNPGSDETTQNSATSEDTIPPSQSYVSNEKASATSTVAAEETVDGEEDTEEEDTSEEDTVDEDSDDGDIEPQCATSATNAISSSGTQSLGLSGGSIEDQEAITVDDASPAGSMKESKGEEKSDIEADANSPDSGGSTTSIHVKQKVSLEPETHPSDMKVSVATWNLAESSPAEAEARFFRQFRGSDLVLISGQECENIKPRRAEGSRSREFRRLMIKMLGKQYVPLGIHSLGGIQFGLFCKRSFLSKIEFVSLADVTCGIGNVFHNKGAIGAFVKVKASKGASTGDDKNREKSLKMLFITAHLAAHVKNTEARDADFWRIVQELESQAPPRFLSPNPSG